MQSRNMAVAPKKAGKGAAAGKPKKVLDVETVFGFKHVIKVNTYLYSD